MSKGIIVNHSIYDSQLIIAIAGAIVGGLIGFISSLFTFFISTYFNRNQTKKEQEIKYEAWLKGLNAEVNHLLIIIQEIGDIFKNPEVTCTKRFSSDYLKEARTKFFEFDNDLLSKTELEILFLFL